MPVTLRSPLATGVALIGAGAIALTPLSPLPADLPAPAIQSTAVQLTAAIDPLEAWVKLFTNTGVSATTLAEQILADPAPILTQLLHNGAEHAQTISTIVQGMGNGVVQWVNDLPMYADMVKTALDEGRFDLAIAQMTYPLFGLAIGIAMPLMSLSSITVGITGNLYNVAQTIANPMTLFGTVLGSLQIMSSFSGQLGVGVQAFADAVKGGDAVAAVNALIATPALVLNGVINGTEFTPGILTPESPTMSPLPGPIAGVMVQVRRAIAQAIGAPAPAAKVAALTAPTDTATTEDPAALPSATADTVAVSLATEPEVKATVVKVAEQATVTDTETTVSDTETTSTDETTETPVVRSSVKSTTGKTAVAAEKLRSDIKTSADSVGKKVNSTVSKIRDGLKKATAKPSAKKADGGTDSAGSGSVKDSE
ncbi:hypothetical protein [Mycolicibacterium neworleansense]|uniref:PE-PGRS family protein n=1 Tax=Mycolicibacterium neworleansense TaxID=146018 RepID=A0A0H5SBI7_9MYCO|nr:hypothetical protein [Mycolicibacterium neworleansense]MCV7363446.1 hypothetical protein [Mycolicibacterium neworleansense]CRZ18784.1 PE-PGRS family protein [Mycolicibacterium neworleansense]